MQKVRTVFETKAKARAENAAYMEEGRRARERLAAGAIAELEAKRATLLQPKPKEPQPQPEPVSLGRALVPVNHGGAFRLGRGSDFFSLHHHLRLRQWWMRLCRLP